MSFVSIDMGNPAAMQRLLAGLSSFPKEQKAAQFKILRTVGKSARSYLVKMAMDRYRLKRKYAERSVSHPVVSQQPPSMKIYVRAEKSRHVTEFSGTGQTRKGVKVSVLKHGGRKLIPHAFIGQGRNSGKAIAFVRTGRGRYPLRAIYSTGGFQFLLRGESTDKLRSFVDDRIIRITMHEVEYRLRRMTKK